MECKVLDKGFIKLIDFMGGDDRVIESARVSRGGTVRGDNRDKKLLAFLIKNDHMTPFESSIFTFHIGCPIFIARQWMRHRWGVFSEISGRYTEFDKNNYYIPEEFFTQSLLDKHTVTKVVWSDEKKKQATEYIRAAINASILAYKELIKNELSKEQARIILPLSMYTEFYWTVHARSLMNFLKLRMSEHAQYEIRQYAAELCILFKEKMPQTYEEFYYKSLYNPV